VSLTGPPKPTFLYPRIKFGTPLVTIDNAETTSRIPTVVPYTGLRGTNTVASGRTEYLFGRDEEQVGLALRCEQDQLAALRWFVQDWAKFGSQFQAWVDRYTGSCWVFENNRKDQNGLALTLNGGGTESYAVANTGTGLVLTGTQYLSVAVAQASATPRTGFDDPLNFVEGIVVIDLKPSFATTDNAQHFFLQTGLTATPPGCLRFWKEANAFSNDLFFELQDGVGGSRQARGHVDWVSADRLTLVGAWSSAPGAVTAWASVNGGALTSLATLTGSGGGMTALPTTLYIGAASTGLTPALGTYDTVAFCDSAYVAVGGLTAKLAQGMATFRPVERNHFPYAELTAAAFQPGRVTLGRPIWDWPIIFRNGVAA
jgi:hypothetical protein